MWRGSASEKKTAKIALISLLIPVLFASLSSLSTDAGSNGSSSVTTTTVNTQSADYQTFIAPYASHVESLRSYLMSAPDPSTQKIGYNSQVGMIEGDYLCGGYQDSFTLQDPNLILGYTLDYLNAQKGITTSINATTRSYMSKQFNLNYPSSSFSNCVADGISVPWTYPDSGYDRREFLFGKISPNYPADMTDCPGGGVRGSNGYVFLTPQVSPPVEAEVQGKCETPTSGSSGMNILAMYVNYLYLAGEVSQAQSLFMATVNAWTPTASTGMGGMTGGYFGGAFQKGGGNVPGPTCPNHTRDLAYWLEMARATGFWDLNNETRALALQVVNEIWAHQNPNGSISVDYPSCGKTRDSGESDGLTLVAFDPRVPSWFSTISPIVTISSTSSSSSITSTATVVSRRTATEALLVAVVAAIVVIAVVAGAVVFMITRRKKR